MRGTVTDPNPCKQASTHTCAAHVAHLLRLHGLDVSVCHGHRHAVGADDVGGHPLGHALLHALREVLLHVGGRHLGLRRQLLLLLHLVRLGLLLLLLLLHVAVGVLLAGQHLLGLQGRLLLELLLLLVLLHLVLPGVALLHSGPAGTQGLGVARARVGMPGQGLWVSEPHPPFGEPLIVMMSDSWDRPSTRGSPCM